MELRSKVIIGLVSASFLLCGGLIGGGYFVGRRYVDFGTAADELPQAEKDYRAAGLPWTAKDIDTRRTGRNAEPAFAKARAALDSQAWGSIAQTIQRDPSPEKLAPFEKAADLAVEASRADYWRVKHDWDQGYDVEFPELAKTRQLTEVLSARAALRAREGDARGAMRDLQAGMAISRLTRDKGAFIPYLSSLGQRTRLRLAFRRASAWTDAQGRRRLLDFSDPALPPDAFSASLRYEAYAGIALMRNLHLKPTPTLGGEPSTKVSAKDLVRDGYPKGTQARAFMTRHLQIWTEVARAIGKTKGEPLALSRELDRIEQENDRQPGLSRLLNKMLFPSFGQASKAGVKEEADRRLSRLYLEALVYRDQHGSLPDSLDALGGNHGDPFGGDLHYRKDGSGFRIWSVGANGKDDGGRTRKEDKKSDDPVGVYPPKN